MRPDEIKPPAPAPHPLTYSAPASGKSRMMLEAGYAAYAAGTPARVLDPSGPPADEFDDVTDDRSWRQMLQEGQDQLRARSDARVGYGWARSLSTAPELPRSYGEHLHATLSPGFPMPASTHSGVDWGSGPACRIRLADGSSFAFRSASETWHTVPLPEDLSVNRTTTERNTMSDNAEISTSDPYEALEAELAGTQRDRFAVGDAIRWTAEDRYRFAALKVGNGFWYLTGAGGYYSRARVRYEELLDILKRPETSAVAVATGNDWRGLDI